MSSVAFYIDISRRANAPLTEDCGHLQVLCIMRRQTPSQLNSEATLKIIELSEEKNKVPDL